MKTTTSDVARVGSAVGFYFIISISLVFINKAVLKDSSAPIFVTWVQLWVTVGILWVLGEIAQRLSRKDHPWFVETYPPLTLLTPSMLGRVLPLSLAFLGMVVFNNLCLQYTSVALYQVARSLTIVWSIVFTFVILSTRTSLPAIGACMVVVLGFVLGVKGELRADSAGIIFGVTASAFVALNSIYVKKVMPDMSDMRFLMWADTASTPDEARSLREQFEKGSDSLLMAGNNLVGIVLLLPLIFITGEWRVLLEKGVLFDFQFVEMLLISGVFGFLISVATVMQIRVTSPLTHNLSGTLKACVQTILAVAVFNEELTFAVAFGTIIVLGGSFAYSYIRFQEMQQQKKVLPS